MKTRCSWCGTDPLYVTYHDEEWGVPVYDDQKLFEFIVLESAQAGLSWITILRRRDGYRKVFKNFDPNKVAKMTEGDVERLMEDVRIIRNRKKIEATIKNAQAFLIVAKEWGSFAEYMWSWVPEGKPIDGDRHTLLEVPVTTDLATAMAKDLKKRGFTFLGPTIWYAHMQACGMVNDHTAECFRYQEIKKLCRKKQKGK